MNMPAGLAPDTAAGYALALWLNGIGQCMDAVDSLSRDTVAGPGWSQVMDVSRAPTLALAWLGQFVGVRVDPNQADAVQRAQIQAEAGFSRGTPAALMAAARKYLRGAQRVALVERDTSPYHFHVQVFAFDLLGEHWSGLDAAYTTWAAVDAAYGTWAQVDSTAAAELGNALAAATPGGLQMSLSIATSGSWADFDSASFAGSWSDAQDMFTTWDAADTWLPPA
jgi:hypothetical protein